MPLPLLPWVVPICVTLPWIARASTVCTATVTVTHVHEKKLPSIKVLVLLALVHLLRFLNESLLNYPE